MIDQLWRSVETERFTHPRDNLKKREGEMTAVPPEIGSIASPSLSLEDIPSSLWANGVLFVPPHLADAHRDQLAADGALESYQSEPNKPGSIGGNSASEAMEHFVWRFLNSAARAGFVCADPHKVNQEVQNLLLEQLTDGALQVLDIAAGHGAGTLAVLSFIGVMRQESKLPKLPLNVGIRALDFSPDALVKYQEMVHSLTPWLSELGIHLTIEASVVDLKVQGEVSQLLDTFFEDARVVGCNRFLCILSAISGIGAEPVAEMQGSFQEIAARIGNKPGGSWLWIEPPSGKWLDVFIAGISYTLRKIKHVLRLKGETFSLTSSGSPFVGDSTPSQGFRWRDPHCGIDVKSHVMVVTFSAAS